MRPSTVMPIRQKGRQRVAGVAVLTTALAGLLVPLGATTASANTGSKNYNCGKSASAISRADWPAEFDVTAPTKAYVNQTYDVPLTSGSKVTVHSNESSYRVGKTVSGPFRVPMSFGGTPVTLVGTGSVTMKAAASAPFNPTATGTWITPGTPGNVDVTMNSFVFEASGGFSYTYNCTGTSTPSPYTVTTIPVWSKSYVTSTLAATTSVQRNDALTATATVSVDGGTPAGTVKVSVAGGAALPYPVVNGQATFAVPTDLEPGEYPIRTDFIPTDSAHYDPSTRETTLVVREAVGTTTTVQMTTPAYADEITTGTATVTAPVGNPVGKPAGTVDLLVDGTVVANVPLNAATGQASLAIPAGLAPGAHPVVAVFKPANVHHFGESSATSSVTVNPPAAATTTVLALDATEVQSSVKPNVTATVTAASGLAKGAVEFRIDGALVATEPLLNGMANVDLPKQGVGTHQITGRFVATDALLFKNSTSAPITLSVVADAKATTTTITPERTVSTPAQTTKVLVRTQGGSGTLTGDIVLQAAGKEYTKTVNASGEAEFTLPELAEGEYPITARYVSGNLNWWLNSRADATLTVALPTATTTTLTVNEDRIVAQAALPVQVHVDTSSGIPNGVVEISVDGQHDVSSPLPSDGLVRTAISGMSPGTHSIVARFVPASNSTHAASTSSARSVTVIDQARITLDTPASVADDARATVSAVVTQIAGVPDGDVTFAVNGKDYDGTLAEGRYSAQIDQLAAGTYHVTASYVSSSGAITATAQAVTLVVTPTPGNNELPGENTTTPKGTTTTVKLASAKLGYGATTRATVSVAPLADGWVRVNVAGRELSARLANGTATLTLPVVAVGARPVTAVFVPADPTAFNGSTGTTTLTVAKASTKLSLTVASAAKKQLTVTTTVKAPIAQKFTGKVTLVLRTTNKLAKKKTVKKVLTISGNGVTTVTLKGLTKGTWTVTAAYAGSTQAGASKAAKKAKVK